MAVNTDLDTYLRLMAQHGASDLFFTVGAPPSMKINGLMKPVSKHILDKESAVILVETVLDDQHLMDFHSLLEANVGLEREGIGRFRCNVYYQRGGMAMVIRYIKDRIPTMAELNLPDTLKGIVEYKTGLVLVVGATGSGKSTTLASMIDHRNATMAGHILTIEDPIEFSHPHKKSIVGQREVGLDTLSYENALREAMREAPDVILIGEIRDRDTMEKALAFADTGHLCLSTLHATNANQALDRIVNFFPQDARSQLLMDMSMNLKAIVSQRLIKSITGGRVPAIEILLNSPFVSELIKANKVDEIKEAMEKGTTVGMQTFDQSLLDLYLRKKIEMKDAMKNADSESDMEWKINFGGGVNALKAEEVSQEAIDGFGALPKIE